MVCHADLKTLSEIRYDQCSLFIPDVINSACRIKPKKLKHEVWESVNVLYVNVCPDEQLAVLKSTTLTCA